MFKRQENYIGDNPLVISGQTAGYDERDPRYVSAAVSTAHHTLDTAYNTQTVYFPKKPLPKTLFDFIKVDRFRSIIGRAIDDLHDHEEDYICASLDKSALLFPALNGANLQLCKYIMESLDGCMTLNTWNYREHPPELTADRANELRAQRIEWLCWIDEQIVKESPTNKLKQE